MWSKSEEINQLKILMDKVKQDWSQKIEGQSKVFLPRSAMATERVREGVMAEEEIVIEVHSLGKCLAKTEEHPINRTIEHICGVKAPHTGDHECVCGYTWPGEAISGPSNP